MYVKLDTHCSIDDGHDIMSVAEFVGQVATGLRCVFIVSSLHDRMSIRGPSKRERGLVILRRFSY